MYMATLSIDTHNAVKVLIDAGYSEKQAEGVVSIFQSAELKEIATKQDVHQLRGDIKDLRTELYRILMVQTVVTVGAVVGILQLIS